MKTTLMMIGVLALAIGCGDKKDGDSKEGGDTAGKKGAAGGDKKAPEAKLQWKKIGDWGVEAEVAPDANIDDNTKTAGFPTATLWASPTTFVSSKNEMFWQADAAKAKEEIKKDPNKFQSFTKEEANGEEFHLEFTLESMMDKKPVYGVKMRRKIGEKLYDCGSNTSSEAERAKVIKLCKSLRAAK